MKRLIVILCLFTCFDSVSQVTPYFPPRTPVLGQSARVIQDNDLRARFSFWMPYTASTTPAIRTIDSVGSNVQLLSNGNLAVSQGLGAGFRQYNPSSVLTTTYQTLANLSTDLSASSTRYPSVNAINTGLNLKANLASPSFTGTPLVPTAAVGTNTTQAASTAFVKAAIDIVAPITIITAADITLSATAFISYTGTGSTFTLPTPVSSPAKYWKIIHRGASGTLTINTNAGANTLYSGGALVNTISLAVGEMITLVSDGTYIIVYP